MPHVSPFALVDSGQLVGIVGQRAVRGRFSDADVADVVSLALVGLTIRQPAA
jgi:hypothetical protein